MSFDHLLERLVVTQILYLLNCLDRIYDINLVKKFCIDMGEQFALLVYIVVDSLKLVNHALANGLLHLVATDLRGCVVNVDDFASLLVLNDHTFLQIVEKLIVSDAQNFRLYIVDPDLDEAHAHEPHPRANHQARQDGLEHVELLVVEDVPAQHVHAWHERSSD